MNSFCEIREGGRHVGDAVLVLAHRVGPDVHAVLLVHVVERAWFRLARFKFV